MKREIVKTHKIMICEKKDGDLIVKTHRGDLTNSDTMGVSQSHRHQLQREKRNHLVISSVVLKNCIDFIILF